MWEQLRLLWFKASGRLANLAGFPCFVRPCEYTGLASVSVKCTHLFTVVTVNGVHVYFQRGTGTFDGVGLNSPD